jgi:16S rRNA (adenine1518-N6/adenine1519-N6)-dimethyltransferase
LAATEAGRTPFRRESVSSGPRVQEAGPRQTLSYLRQLFEGRGLHPSARLGQSFLIDQNLLDLVTRTAELGKNDVVLEVGTGTGGLTQRLCERAGLVLSVEIDSQFHDLAEALLGPRPNLKLVRADILQNKNRLNPAVTGALSEVLARSPKSSLKLVANLPYVVATPVIANLLLSDFPLERLVVMVQSELAARILAKPGSSDYGALAVLVQSLAQVEMTRAKIPPGVFWPRPQVTSAIICIRPDAGERRHVGDVAAFRDFLRALYTHRRKNLRTALAALPWIELKKTDIDTKLMNMGLDPTVRAETLDGEQHLSLAKAFGK